MDSPQKIFSSKLFAHVIVICVYAHSTTKILFARAKCGQSTKFLILENFRLDSTLYIGKN